MRPKKSQSGPPPSGLWGLLCLLLVFLWSATGGAVELTSEVRAYLQAKGSIVFVSQTHYPPFELTETDRQREGMMLDLVRWLAVEIGFQPLFEDMSFQSAQEAVLAGRADVLTSLFFSDKRKEQFAFTRTLFEVPTSIFIRTERTNIKDMDDLHGKTIAMQRGDLAQEFLESQGIQFSMLATEDFGEATDRVIDGKADAVIGDEQIVLHHLYSNRQTGFVKKVGSLLYIGNNCMASSQDKALLIAILNKGVEEARASGVLDKIGKKWLGTTYGPQESELRRFFLPVGVAATLLLIALLAVWLWNRQLRTQVRVATAILVRREEALRESEHNFRVFFDTMADLLLVGGRTDRIVDCELQVRRKDGTIIDGVFFGELVARQGQKSFLTVMIDQTDHRRAEQAVRESEERYRRLFASMLDVYCQIDRDGVVTMISPSVTRVTGYQPEEVVGTNVERYYDNPVDSYRILSLMVKSGFIEHFELAVRTKSGTRRWLSCSARLAKGKESGFTHIEGIARDITDLRQVTLALQQELAFHNAIIANITDGLCVFHALTVAPLLRFTVWNDRMTEITGHAMEVVNQSGWYLTLFPDPDLRELVMAQMQAVRQGEELRAEEWLITRADGERRTVSVSTSFVASEQGTASWLALVRDVTEMKQAEQARRQINQQLQQALKLESLGRMAGATAHHFNNILGAVLGYLELLQNDISGNFSQSRLLAKAMRATFRAVELSHFMLKYAGGQGRRGQVVPDLSVEVERMLSLIGGPCSSDVTLETALATGLPTVNIDLEDLRDILVNLTTNAMEALNEAGGLVKVVTGAGYFNEESLRGTIGTFIPSPGQYVFLEVTDNGCGMERETVTRMFDPFFSTKFDGRGLGLARVSGIIRSCQGGMLVDSESGRGSTVRILMPAAEPWS